MKVSQRWSIFTCRTTSWGKRTFLQCPVISSPILALALRRLYNGIQWYRQLLFAFFSLKLKKGTQDIKRGPKGDPNSQKGPLGDPGTLKGDPLCNSVFREKRSPN